MANIVIVSGQFNVNGTYFADSPVIIRVEGLAWPSNSPFTVVRVEVIYNGKKVGDFHIDTGRQTTTTLDISSALRAIWADYDYADELSAANAACGKSSVGTTRSYRSYSMEVYTEYLSDDGVFTQTHSGSFSGGKCMMGGLTEWERSGVGNTDASTQELTNLRYGDASTKPHAVDSAPERVGIDSITSWVDLGPNGTRALYCPVGAKMDADTGSEHVPTVLRDSQQYADFIFINRRGAVETCSALVLESMGIDVDVQQYGRAELPSFKPSRSLMAIGTDGRRSWQMSSGYVTREWAEWWVMDFLGGKRKRWWMRYPLYDPNGRYVPVVVQPAKRQTSVYDRAKQQMPRVEFTVTLALEG